MRRLCLILAALLALVARPVSAGDAKPGRARFLDLAAGRAAIVDDHLEPYFETLEPAEMAAKTGSTVPGATQAERVRACRERYRDGVREFTEEEKAAVGAAVEKIVAALSTDYPLAARAPWSYVKVTGSIEGGLPHTRGEHVVLSEPVLAGLLPSLAAGARGDAERGALNVLVHEHMHVVQRLHPEVFAKLYRDVWGFRRVPPIPLTPWLRTHHLANPDGVDTGWVFPVKEGGSTRWIWPLVVLGREVEVPSMPQDLLLLAVDVREEAGGKGAFSVVPGDDGGPRREGLLEVEAYRKTFPGSMNVYHPNEAAADLFAEIVVRDAFSGAKEAAAGDALEPLRVWFRANLK